MECAPVVSLFRFYHFSPRTHFFLIIMPSDFLTQTKRKIAKGTKKKEKKSKNFQCFDPLLFLSLCERNSLSILDEVSEDGEKRATRVSSQQRKPLFVKKRKINTQRKIGK